MNSVCYTSAIRWLATCLLLFLSSTPTLQAQPQAYTPAQVERLAKLSELYAHVKFFHPYLGYQKINWDSAYAASAPLLAQARTDDATADALRHLLAVLHDPATTVRLVGLQAAPAPVAATDSLRVFWAADSTLVLQTNAYAGAEKYKILLRSIITFVKQLPRARAVLLDLRSTRPLTEPQQAGFFAALDYVRLPRYLSAQPYATPAMRLRGHSGFAPEDGNSSGGYYSYFYTKAGSLIKPYQTARSRPTAILVNENAALPPAFVALATQPQVRLFSTGPVAEAALAETASFAFSPTITVTFRTGELVNTDGTLGLVGRSVVPPTVRPEAAEAYALAHLYGPRPVASAGRPAPPAPVPPAAYAPGTYPALGYRLLAGAKMWAVIHYFHAYRDLYPTSWDAALRPALTELAAAADATAYALAVAHYYRHLQDGHGFVSSPALRSYIGTGGILADVKFVEDKPVISKLYGDSLQAKGLHVGDVLTAINGEPVATRVARLSAILTASNEWTRRQYVAENLLHSPPGTLLRLEVLGANNQPHTLTLRSQPASRLEPGPDTTASYKVLPGNIGYVNLDRLESEDTDRMFAALFHTKAIIFDMRGYPHSTAWTIAPRLSARPQPEAARFARYIPSQPSLPGNDGLVTEKMFFTQTIPPNTDKPIYPGKTVMLIDERTQSQGEHTGLFFEAANGTEFIGSPTAGADGDVTNFSIPGAIALYFSGQVITHADGRQLQQTGLQPKLLVHPTLKGLRANQDEVLARAVKYVTSGK